MAEEPKELDITLTREVINLFAHGMALQVVAETILKRLDGDEFNVAQFRRELKELTEKCRERVLLDFEKHSPGVAAFLDANRPFAGEEDGAAEPEP